jgi:hypothetical protein
MNKLGILSIIILAVFMRLFPHGPNFVPIGALALFGGSYINKRFSIAVILAVMFVSDYLLLYFSPYAAGWFHFTKIYSPTVAFHSSTIYVYASMLIYVLIGQLISKNRTVLTVGAGALLGSIQFFLITNAAVWINGAYARDLSGLWQSYVMGIPFFKNTLLGDLFYTAAFFGSFELVKLLISKKAKVPSESK